MLFSFALQCPLITCVLYKTMKNKKGQRRYHANEVANTWISRRTNKPNHPFSARH
jgi:hypothetical protein